MSKTERQSNYEVNEPTSRTIIKVREPKRHLDDIEAHLRAVRQGLGLSHNQLARQAGMSPSAFIRFENGKRRRNIEYKEKVIDAIGNIASEDNEHAVAAVTLLTASDFTEQERTRVQSLIEDAAFSGTVIFKDGRVIRDRVFNQVSQANSFGEAILKLCNDAGITLNDLAKKADIHPTILQKLDKRKRKVTLFTANKVIDALEIERTDKAAQYLRLHAQSLKPMTLKELRTVEAGKVVQYLRTIEGFARPELGEILFLSKSTIENVENDTYKTVVITNIFSPWLGDDPIKDVLKVKYSSGVVIKNKALLQQVLDGRFLFEADLLQTA
ncbi:MAG: transcriptional regulator [Candidatus Levybacteria bacterium]|nr:transcriptional regulator [Candidatus Levybacteria bacterium]